MTNPVCKQPPRCAAPSSHALHRLARLVSVHDLGPHPAALPAFLAFQHIVFAAPLDPALAWPAVVMRGARPRWLMIGNFAGRLALRHADRVPVLVVPTLDDATIARSAWSEVAALPAGHLARRGGAESLYLGLKAMPDLLRAELCGALSARGLAGLLGVDAGRFQGITA